MPIGAIIAIAVGVLLLALAAVAAVYGWRAYERRLLLRIVGRTEALEAALAALIDVVTRLASSSDEELAHFADEPDSGERRVLHDIALKTTIIRDELDHMPLPRSLVGLAEFVADAAYIVGREAGRVEDDQQGDDALDRLAGMDLPMAKEYVLGARRMLIDVCTAHGLDDMAVYGGGLYL